MILLICKKCGKHNNAKELRKNSIIDISTCSLCGSSLKDAERFHLTKEEENIENIICANIIEEAKLNNSEKGIPLDEFLKSLK